MLKKVNKNTLLIAKKFFRWFHAKKRYLHAN